MNGFFATISIAIIVIISSITGTEAQATAIVTDVMVNDSEVQIVEPVEKGSSINDKNIEQAKDELESLGPSLVKNNNSSNVLNEFETYVGTTSLDILYVYYGTSEGEFFVWPMIELPDSYDCRERPWYKDAIEHGTFVSEIYEDAASMEKIQSVSSTIVNEGELSGVIGVDFYVEYGIDDN